MIRSHFLGEKFKLSLGFPLHFTGIYTENWAYAEIYFVYSTKKHTIVDITLFNGRI